MKCDIAMFTGKNTHSDRLYPMLCEATLTTISDFTFLAGSSTVGLECQRVVKEPRCSSPSPEKLTIEPYPVPLSHLHVTSLCILVVRVFVLYVGEPRFECMWEVLSVVVAALSFFFSGFQLT
jgi:hypothetical protein